MKNDWREIVSWIGTFLIFFVIFTSGMWLPKTVDWLKHSKPPETEQVVSSVEEVQPPTAEEIEQEKILQLVKQAEGHSVLIRTEKIGDDMKHLIVRHYARWSELGEVEYWVEVVK